MRQSCNRAFIHGDGFRFGITFSAGFVVVLETRVSAFEIKTGHLGSN